MWGNCHIRMNFSCFHFFKLACPQNACWPTNTNAWIKPGSIIAAAATLCCPWPSAYCSVELRVCQIYQNYPQQKKFRDFLVAYCSMKKIFAYCGSVILQLICCCVVWRNSCHHAVKQTILLLARALKGFLQTIAGFFFSLNNWFSWCLRHSFLMSAVKKINLISSR